MGGVIRGNRVIAYSGAEKGMEGQAVLYIIVVYVLFRVEPYGTIMLRSVEVPFIRKCIRC